MRDKILNDLHKSDSEEEIHLKDRARPKVKNIIAETQKKFE